MNITLPECKYHVLSTSISEQIYEKIENHYDWDFFYYWLGDSTETNFADCYREGFESLCFLYSLPDLSQEQIELVENKGRNLEEAIGKWFTKFHISRPNEKIPLQCLKQKINEYVSYQLKKPEIRRIIGNPCC